MERPPHSRIEVEIQSEFVLKGFDEQGRLPVVHSLATLERRERGATVKKGGDLLYRFRTLGLLMLPGPRNCVPPTPGC